jgi:hypothetical protein
VSWSGALCCATLGAFAPATSVSAGVVSPGQAAADAPGYYVGITQAVGVEYQADTSPAATPISDLVDMQSPQATSNFDSSGGATARAASMSLGGLGDGASIYCLAAPSSFGPFPNPVQCTNDFPPKYPLAATAAYPAHQDASSTADGSSLGSTALGVTPGTVKAHADLSYVQSDATSSKFRSLDVFPPMSAQHSAATNRQSIVAGALVSTAESTVQGIDIVGVVHIDSVRAVATITNDGVHKPTFKGSVTVHGATAKGQGVTIDNRGIHVVGQSDGGAAQQAINTALSKAGVVAVKVIGVHKADRGQSLSGQAQGVEVTFSHVVAGVPKPPVSPPCVPLPIPSIGDCAGVPSPNRTYFGTALFGSAGDLTVAGAGFTPPTVTPPDTSGVPPVTTTGGGTPTGLGGSVGGTGPTSQFIPGTPGTPGTPATGGQGNVAAPQVATNNGGAPIAATQQGFASELIGADAAKRLVWIVGAFALLALGLAAGRARPAPARLPRAS